MFSLHPLTGSALSYKVAALSDIALSDEMLLILFDKLSGSALILLRRSFKLTLISVDVSFGLF